ncbi:RNA polymerase II transcription factor B subunit 1 [Paramarasmius palmivorus]|uniref:RNA polymerase II transcription factor B subunit 1 n=1 Tax=Paramarasmius palmivorus TaxID=297713 RepID=A0AAW0DKV9_9AGAR
MPTLVCTAKVFYKKLPGVLELTDTHVKWTQDGKTIPLINFPRSEVNTLFCSKEGAAQTRLKITSFNDENGHNFTFISPQAVAVVEREKFKTELTQNMSLNRQAAEKRQSEGTAPASTPNSTPSTPKPLAPTFKQPSTSRAASVSSDLRASPIIPGSDPAADFRLRKNVLLSNPDLAALHRELVIGGHITESEFWEGREHLLLAQVASEAQKKGKPGQLVDPRPETVEGGEIKIRITPQLVHDIFDEYPVVAKAYNDNVPNKVNLVILKCLQIDVTSNFKSKLSEEEFWKRYFQSKLFNAHRASIRSSAAQHVVKDDPIFDQYLEKDDDELEPRRQRDIDVDLFVDLGATNEDHEANGNQKDITMQAGRQKGALPLIRKFNEHSERLLNSALGDGPASKRRRVDEEDEYHEIELEDLNNAQDSSGIVLEMQDQQRYFEGRMTNASAEDSLEQVDIRSVLGDMSAELRHWESKLSELNIARESGDSALLSMTRNVAARLDVKSRRNDIPEGLFIQMRTCQTAANEFLRQYWSATYPPMNDAQTLSLATPAQRATKAAKMIGYLSKTREKVEAIVKAAQQQDIDPRRIQLAMEPLLNAVDRALTFHASKKTPRA